MRFALLFVALAACSSETVVPDALFTNGTVTFTLDGASQVAADVRGLRRTFGGQVLVVGGDVSADQAIQVIVSDSAENAMLTGTYTCPGSGEKLIQLVLGTTTKLSATSCTIDITQAGAPGGDHASGTFSGTFAGGKNVTAGSFDVVVISTNP